MPIPGLCTTREFAAWIIQARNKLYEGTNVTLTGRGQDYIFVEVEYDDEPENETAPGKRSRFDQSLSGGEANAPVSTVRPVPAESWGEHEA